MHSEDFDEGDEQRRYEIRLLIRHPNIDPELITKELGLEPQVTHRAGAVRKTLIGTILPGVYKISSWGFSARVEGKQYFSEDILKLTDLLTPHAAFLSELVEAGGSVNVILHLPGDVTIGDTISPKDLGRLYNLKVGFGVEIFPKFDPDD